MFTQPQPRPVEDGLRQYQAIRGNHQHVQVHGA